MVTDAVKVAVGWLAVGERAAARAEVRVVKAARVVRGNMVAVRVRGGPAGRWAEESVAEGQVAVRMVVVRTAVRQGVVRQGVTRAAAGPEHSQEGMGVAKAVVVKAALRVEETEAAKAVEETAEVILAAAPGAAMTEVA